MSAPHALALERVALECNNAVAYASGRRATPRRPKDVENPTIAAASQAMVTALSWDALGKSSAITTKNLSITDGCKMLVIDSDLPILHNFKEFLSRVGMERPNLHSQKDLLLWQDTPASNIKTTDVWEVVRHKYDEEPWRKLIWFPNTQPRAQWFVWLACNDRLPTFDRQKKSGISLANRCALCLKEEESAHHIMVCVDGFYTIVRDTGEDRRDLQVWLNTGIVPDKCPRIVTGQACLQVASAASNGRQLVVFMLKDSDGLQRDQGVAWWEVNNVFPEDTILHQILMAGGLENFHEILLISNNKPWTRRLKTIIHGRRSPHGWLNHYSYLLHRLHILQQQPDHDILSLLGRSM
ncbi:hypothetical protein EJ110_NYTH48888 [Nymphaea thermarum]|nr:hypothetical protein EJ110_NYTH48888 [Nymphaea thermarum]